jgi:hypothetical protein
VTVWLSNLVFGAADRVRVCRVGDDTASWGPTVDAPTYRVRFDPDAAATTTAPGTSWTMDPARLTTTVPDGLLPCAARAVLTVRETFTGAAVAAHEGPGDAAGVGLVAVCGSANDANGALPGFGQQRIRTALSLADPADLLLCGGYGAHFNTTALPHWAHAWDWLRTEVRAAPPRCRVAGSRHSYDDVTLTERWAERLGDPPVTMVTSAFHAARIAFIVRSRGLGWRVEAAPDRMDGGELRERTRREQRALTRTMLAYLIFGIDRSPAAAFDVAEHAGRSFDRVQPVRGDPPRTATSCR